MFGSAKKYSVICIYSALILSTLLVYWQVGRFGFVEYDDNVYVYDNQHVSSGLTYDGIVWAFTTGHASFWHPVTWLSLMLDRQLFGPDPGWFHLVSVFLHLANTLLLFAVLKRMTGAIWPSAFVAAAFALHPMHVESVAWIAERKDVLSTFFLLLTLAAYAGYVKRPSAFRYIAALALFAVGLMAKPMLITLPFLLLLLDYWPMHRLTTGRADRCAAGGGGSISTCLIEKIPFFVLTIVFCVITFATQKAGGGIVPTSVIPLKHRLENVFLSYAAYIGKMFWPHNMAANYPPRAVGSITLWQFLSSALLMVGVSLLVVYSYRSRKYLLVGWFWFVGTLVPVIGLIQFAGSSYADRFSYIPYIGLFIMMAWGLPELLAKWPQRQVALGILVAAALAAMGIIAHKQVGYWGDSITLFTHAIEVTQGNDVAYDGRGVSYGNLGRWKEALDDFSEAIRIRPDRAEAYSNRSAIYLHLGRWQEAMEDCDEAIRLKPDDARMFRNRSIAYGRLGREQEAMEDFSHAVSLDPDNADLRWKLAIRLSARGRYDEAVSEYRAALKLMGNWPDCLGSLALLIATHPEIKGRDVNEAVYLASRACELTGYRNPVLMGTLAAAFASAGRFSEAIDTAERALKLADATNQPQVKEAIRYHLSLYKQGRPYVEPVDKLPDSNRP